MKEIAPFLGRMIGAWMLSLLVFPFGATMLHDLYRGEISGGIGGVIVATIAFSALPVLVVTLLAGIPIMLAFREIKLPGWIVPFAAGVVFALVLWVWNAITGGVAERHGLAVFMTAHAATVGLIWGALEALPASDE